MPAISPPSTTEARAFLASTRLFGGLAEAALDEIAAELEWQLVPGGTVVRRQGQAGDGLYLVASGRLVVVREHADGGESIVGAKGRGDSVGEMALLTGAASSATTRALRDSILARLPRERAEALLKRHPDALFALTRLFAGWLGEKPPEAARGCVAVAVTAGSPGVDLPDFGRRLAASLGALGPALHLNAAAIDSRFGHGFAHCPDGTAEHRRLTAWIDEQEAAHGVVLYEAEAEPSPWTRRCLRQADRILVVVAPRDAGAAPTLGPLSGELAAVAADQGRQLEELVVLHQNGRRPRGTAGWLALRPFTSHHHMRPDRTMDFDRLARFLSGRAVGVVLGGGGARGFAHIGVLRALEESGIPVDRIGGASMGAVLAAQYARGTPWQEMIEQSRNGWVKMAPQKVYTLPLISVLSSRKAVKMLAMMYEGDLIEDLWLDYFCVSTNLSRTELMIHRSGSVEEAISASISIPGITPPILGPNRDLLVDGGVLDNLPADVMRRLGPGPIVAVDVSATLDLSPDPSYDRTPNPWKLLAARLRLRKPPPFPNILRLIQRSAMLASDVYAKHAKGQVELYLDLPMDGFDMFEMEALDRIVEFGYQFACAKLAEPEAKAALRVG